MTRPPAQQDSGAVIVLLIAVMGGIGGVLGTLMATMALIGPQATEAERLSRVASYVVWTQPFVYNISGLLAGARDSRWGPVRAPVIGIFLAAVCWMLLRQRDLLASEPNILAYLLPAGALFSLFGAMAAPLLRDRVGSVVTGIVVLGIVAYILAYLNLGAISGQVTREMISRAQDMTMRMDTVPVPGVPVALRDSDDLQTLYTTQTRDNGRYMFTKVPIGEYLLRVQDPVTASVISDQARVDRAITGGTPWQTIALPSMTRDSGALFE